MILIICLIGLLVGSVFGIFFSGEDSGNGMTMQSVVREINADYDSRLDEIINGTSHDVLEMSGSRAVWKEVLAVYSVKTITDPDNPQEVATMDDNKKQLLKDIFWEMNEISSRTEDKTETQITESDDGHGNIVETETTVTQTYLYITVSHKTAEEMADRYGFNEEQRQQLSELLAEENNSLWSAVLYGITIGDGEIVTVALSQVAASRIGAGTVLTGVWNGVPVSFRGVPTSAAISPAALSPSLQAVSTALSGLRTGGSGRTVALRQKQDKSSSLTGRVTGKPTMSASWNGARTASSTPWRATLEMPVGSGATLSGAALSTATASLPIKNGQKKNRGA